MCHYNYGIIIITNNIIKYRHKYLLLINYYTATNKIKLFLLNILLQKIHINYNSCRAFNQK